MQKKTRLGSFCTTKGLAACHGCVKPDPGQRVMKGLPMHLEDLQRVLTHEELRAFGLFPAPLPKPVHAMVSPELVTSFHDHPTAEFERTP